MLIKRIKKRPFGFSFMFRFTLKNNNGNSGFTLIEVLIALVILGIALIPLLVSQARAVSDYGYTNDVAYETILAKNIMSNVFLSNDISITNKQENISGVKEYKAQKKISKTSYPGVYVIKITVFKKDRGPESGVTLKSLVLF